MDKTPEFAKQLDNMFSDPFSERVVRLFISGIATSKEVPLELIHMLGCMVLEYRRNEIKDEIARN